MSTHAIIARATAGGWEGRYVHFDGRPTLLGRKLWSLYHQVFGGDLTRMLGSLLDHHPAGWWSLQAVPGQQCRCHDEHGRRLTDHADELLTPENREAWAYVLDEQRGALSVLAPDLHEGWASLAIVSLSGPEPDWQEIEERAL